MPEAAPAAAPETSAPPAASAVSATATATTPAPAAAPAATATAAAPDPKVAFEKAWSDFKGADDVKEIAEFAKASGFPPGTVAVLAAREKARAQSEEAEYKQLSEKGWLDELTADKQLGGEKIRETMVDVMRAHDRMSPEIQKMIKDEGVLYNPVVVRVLHDIGSKLKEDSFVRPGSSPAPDQKKTLDQRLESLWASGK